MARPDQPQYDRFVKNGMRAIYSRKRQGVAALLKSLDGDGDPVTGLSNTVTTLAMGLSSSAERAGQSLSPDVVLHGSGELLEQLADFSRESGGHVYSDKELRLIGEHMVRGAKGAPPRPAAPAAAPPAAGMAAPPARPELMPRGGYGA